MRFSRRLRAFYEVNGDLRVAGAQRRYLLRVPEGHNPERPAPLGTSTSGQGIPTEPVTRRSVQFEAIRGAHSVIP